MNIPDEHGFEQHGFEERGFDEREWQAQERAQREARAGIAGAPEAEEPALAQYRAIARALREPPAVALPAGFAADVARRARARAAVPDTFERWLVRALVAAFALGALGALGVYGARVLAALDAAIGAQGVQWLGLAAGCVALSWSFDWLRRRTGGDDGSLRPA
jgi:hypothetical protein